MLYTTILIIEKDFPNSGCDPLRFSDSLTCDRSSNNHALWDEGVPSHNPGTHVYISRTVDQIEFSSIVSL